MWPDTVCIGEGDVMRVAVVQLNSSGERDENVARALQLVDQAANQGTQFVLLPEYMTFLGAYSRYAEMSETVPGPTSRQLAATARRHAIYLHGGSLIQKTHLPDRFYNTSLLFDPQGELMARYRKVHLFDVNVPGQVTDTESHTILPGDSLTIAALPECNLGLSICFDLRFPEMYRQMAAAGAEVFVVPAAFARATGRAHWEILLRARAIENHAYVLAAAQYGKDAAGHWRYGRSMMIDPWGEVLAAAPEMGEQVLIADISREVVLRRRQQMPVLDMRRPDVYASSLPRDS
jgi:predicted amidohydrolase